MSLAAASIVECHFKDSLNLSACICAGIVGMIVAFVFFSEIHAARKLTDAHKIGSADYIFAQRRLAMDQRRECGHRPDICKQSQLLPHCQKTLLGANLQVEYGCRTEDRRQPRTARHRHHGIHYMSLQGTDRRRRRSQPRRPKLRQTPLHDRSDGTPRSSLSRPRAIFLDRCHHLGQKCYLQFH